MIESGTLRMYIKKLSRTRAYDAKSFLCDILQRLHH